MALEHEINLGLSAMISSDLAQEKADLNKNKLRITRGVNRKAQLYAELTREITGTSMECYGYLLRPKWSTENLITNIQFADEQLVTSGDVIVPVEGIIRARKALDLKGYEIVGWWHSHGELPVFHSGTDKRNFLKVLNGVSPTTIFRHEVAEYIIEEAERRVTFENYALTDLSPAEIELFKKRQIKTVKKVEQEPNAFSMVVNVYGDRYLEKLTKSKDPRTGNYSIINKPTKPQLELVDVPHDLEFRVADLEFEIRDKIIVNNGSHYDLGRSRRQQDRSKEFSYVDCFIRGLTRYVKRNGKYKAAAQAILNGDMTDVFAAVLSFGNSESTTASNDNNGRSVKQNLISYLEDVSTEDYSNWRKKIHFFERKHIIAARFMQTFCNVTKHYGSFQATKMQNQVFEEAYNLADNLTRSFELANKGMKALTKYAMEDTTDYENTARHKYKNLIGAIVTKICKKDIFSFEAAATDVVETQKTPERKKVFIWKDRFNICDQLIIDAYQTDYNPTEQRDNEIGLGDDLGLLGFIDKFADLYNTDPSKVDSLIETQLLSKLGVTEEKYSLFRDSTYSPIVKRSKEFRSYSIRNDNFMDASVR